MSITHHSAACRRRLGALSFMAGLDRVATLDGKSFAFRVWYWFHRGRGLSEREAARAAIEAVGCAKLANQVDAGEAAA